MIIDAEEALTDAISHTDIASKGRRLRVIPINKDLRAALEDLKAEADNARRPSAYVVTTERPSRTSS